MNGTPNENGPESESNKQSLSSSLSDQQPESNAGKYLIWLSFLNGAGIMAFEMISGKMLAPFYGTSLEVWSVTLATVMTGLAAGYSLGGRIARKMSTDPGIIFFLGATFLLYAPLPARFFMNSFYQVLGPWGSILSSLFIILPFMVVAGAISPVLIQISSGISRYSGYSSGKIFALSTIGGIFSTFLTGFLMIPEMGIELSIFSWGMIYFGIAVCFFLNNKNKRLRYFYLSVPMILAIANVYHSGKGSNEKILYRETGLYGELMVADIPLVSNGMTYQRRLLLSNRVGQTNIDSRTGISLWDYSHYLSTIAGAKPEGSDALLLGLAGGNIANELSDLHIHVDAVDLDPRVHEVAQKFFNLNSGVRFIEDDARHFLNKNKKAYDLVIADLYAGEGVPSHVITLESLDKIKTSLKKEGLLIINFHGYIDGEEGTGFRALYHTLNEAGYMTAFLATPGIPSERNCILVAAYGQKKSFFSQLRYRQNECCRMRPVPNPPPLMFLNPSVWENAPILTDEKPMLEILNRKANREWRIYAIEHYLIELNKEGLPFF